VAVFDAGDAARFGIRAPANVTQLDWPGMWRLRGLSGRCGPQQALVREITP
jgi:hypothetical protein